MNVEDYLRKKYGTFQKLSNGTYYVMAKDKTEIYFPSSFSSSTKVYAFMPGQGGSNKGTRSRNLMEKYTPSDYLTIIAPSSEDPTRVLDQATQIVKDNNSKVGGVVVSGFSLGARQTMVTMNNYLKKHPEVADSSAVVMTDGWIKNYYKRTDLEELKKSQVPLIYVSGAGEKMEDRRNYKVDTIMHQLTNAGFNVIGVKSHDSGHVGYNNDVIANGFVPFIFGDKDRIGNINANTKDARFTPYYEFYRFNPKTKKYEAILKTRNSSDYSRLAFLQIDANDIEANDIIVIEDAEDEVITDENIIQSDNQFLQIYLTNINTNISALAATKFNLTVSSTTQVPRMEVGIINQLNSSVSMLSQKIHDELVLFGKVGNRFSNLDLKLDDETQVLMAAFQNALIASKMDIPIEPLTTYDYDLEQLIKDYNDYVTEFRANFPKYNSRILRDKDMMEEIYQVTAEDLDALFAHWAETTGNENSKLIGMGAAFIAASEATGIDALTLVGLCGKETGYGGTGDPGNAIDDNNFFGIEGSDGQAYVSWESPEEGIMEGALKIKEDYYDQGITTVGNIGVDPSSDPVDKSYGEDVAAIMDESLDYIVDNTAKPLEGYTYPEIDKEDPEIEPKPETPEPKPETPEPKPETPEPKPETPEPKPETPEPKPETPEPKPETPEPKPETPEPKPETPEPKPETPEPKPETPEPKPETPEPKPETPEPKPETPEPKPETPEPKPETPEPKPETPEKDETSSTDTSSEEQTENPKEESQETQDTQTEEETIIDDSQKIIDEEPLEDPEPSIPSRPDPINKPDKNDTENESTITPSKNEDNNKYINLDDEKSSQDKPIDEVIDEPIDDSTDEEIEEPIKDITDEDSGLIIEPTPDDEGEIVEPEPIVEIPDNQDDGNDTLKTVGIIAGLGAGIGAAAYGAHKIIEKNNKDDDNY